jgi:hypothetical protein
MALGFVRRAAAARAASAAAAEDVHESRPSTAGGEQAADGPRPPAATEATAPSTRPFSPDAALVNYYRPGDTLGGHVDDAEADMAQPIVTASLGCAAVFLIGGETRDAPPTALLLRSGDVVVMAEAARRSFHGVPRVLEGEGLPEGLEAALQRRAGGGGDDEGEGEGAEAEEAALRRACFEAVRGWRINISVRCIS